MSAGGVAVEHHALTGAQPHEQAGAPDLIDDLGDGHLRAEIVADDRDRHAVGIEPARHVAEQRWVERAPVAAVDEQRERRDHAGARRKQVDELAQGRSVAQSELGAPLLHRFGPVILGRARPAGEDFGVLGYAGAVVVFGLVIDRHALSPRASLSPLSACREREGKAARFAFP
jgi:hypothetical protein